jgi:hypothetical protein
MFVMLMYLYGVMAVAGVVRIVEEAIGIVGYSEIDRGEDKVEL